MSTSIISTRSVGGRIKSSGGGNTREGGLLLLRCRSNQHRGEYDRPHPREGERCLATAAARRHGCCCYAAYKLQRSGDVVIRSMRWRWIWRIFCLRFRHLAIKPGVNAIFWSTKLLTHSTLNRFRDIRVLKENRHILGWDLKICAIGISLPSHHIHSYEPRNHNQKIRYLSSLEAR